MTCDLAGVVGHRKARVGVGMSARPNADARHARLSDAAGGPLWNRMGRAKRGRVVHGRRFGGEAGQRRLA